MSPRLEKAVAVYRRAHADAIAAEVAADQAAEARRAAEKAEASAGEALNLARDVEDDAAVELRAATLEEP